MPWPPQCGLERYDSIAIRIDAVLLGSPDVARRLVTPGLVTR